MLTKHERELLDEAYVMLAGLAGNYSEYFEEGEDGVRRLAFPDDPDAVLRGENLLDAFNDIERVILLLWQIRDARRHPAANSNVPLRTLEPPTPANH
jgi:hypothetical protein